MAGKTIEERKIDLAEMRTRRRALASQPKPFRDVAENVGQRTTAAARAELDRELDRLVLIPHVMALEVGVHGGPLGSFQDLGGLVAAAGVTLAEAWAAAVERVAAAGKFAEVSSSEHSAALESLDVEIKAAEAAIQDMELEVQETEIKQRRAGLRELLKSR